MNKMIMGLIIVSMILVSTAICVFIWPNTIVNESVEQEKINATIDISPTPYVHHTNEIFVLPSKEHITSTVNWSRYHIFRYCDILALETAEPNTIINHTFIHVRIRVDVLDPENVPDIYTELSSVVKAVKVLVGPDSSVEVWGYVPDGRIFKAGMLPFSSTIYRRDYVHPVHNLTFSDIDASEVD